MASSSGVERKPASGLPPLSPSQGTSSGGLSPAGSEGGAGAGHPPAPYSPPPASLVDLYLSYSKDLPSPALFRKWAAIHAIGAAGERRLWTQFGRLRLHPNLFVFLVGPPGTGKTVALAPMSELLRKAQACTIAPNDITKQGLLDALAKSTKAVMLTNSEGISRPFDYSFLSLVISELSNFMSKYDLELTGLLTDLFDCPAVNEEKKRSGAGATIPGPGISFIMGTATKNLGTTIGEEMWGSGFMARVIMVYSADKVVPPDRFHEASNNDDLASEIIERLKTISAFKGPMLWSVEARAMMNAFCQAQEDGAPLHNRLEHYVTRRWLHLAKLCMIAALSTSSTEIYAEHFDLAYEWLVEVESTMTEVFKDMASHEDGAIYEDLRHFLFTLHASTRRPIHVSAIYAWLAKRVATHNIQRIIEIAEASGYIVRLAGTTGNDAEFKPSTNYGSKDLGKL